MCFRTHRTQKIYSQNNFFFFVNNENSGPVGVGPKKKKCPKNACLKCVLEPIELKKCIYKISIFFCIFWLRTRRGNLWTVLHTH